MKKKTLLVLAICLLLAGCTSKNKMQKYSKEIVNEYNNETITYDRAISDLDSMMSQANSDEKKNILENSRKDIEELKASKDSFEKAEKAYNEKKYEDAINLYNAVVEIDNNYNTAQDKLTNAENEYLKAVYEQAEIYLESDKYDKAIELYNKAKNVVDSDELDKKISEAESKQQTFLDNQIIEMEKTAEKYIDEKDYINALKEYKNLYNLTGDDKYDVKIDGVKNAMVDYAIENAEMFLSEENYNEAKAALSQAKYNVPDDERIKDEEKRIDSLRPVDLSTVKSLSTDSHFARTGYYDGEVEDNIGNTYKDGSIAFTSDNYYGGQEGAYATVTYYLKGEYDKIEGIFALLYDSKDTTMLNYLNIYCDGVLVYSSEALTQGVLPINVSVDISGAQEIKLEYKWTGESSRWIVSDTVFGNAVLKKNYIPLQ